MMIGRSVHSLPTWVDDKENHLKNKESLFCLG
jgi:hypothetical protein